MSDSMLTAAELAQLREDILITLPDTCTIQRKTTTTDDSGNVIPDWANQVVGAVCRVDPISARNIGDTGVRAMREMGITWYQLTVEWDTDIQYGDRVVFDGDTYELVNLFDDHALRAVRRAVITKNQGA